MSATTLEAPAEEAEQSAGEGDLLVEGGAAAPRRAGSGRHSGGTRTKAAGRRGRRPAAARQRAGRRRAPSIWPKVAAFALTATCLLGLWAVLFATGLSTIQASGDQQRLYDAFRAQLALATAPVGGSIEPGAPVALLEFPAAGLEAAVVVEGTTSTLLQSGPGHRRNTPLPGQPGVTLLYAKGVTFGGPFAGISSVSDGARIEVTTGQGQFEYVVDGVRRPGDPLPAALAQGGSRLTLVTAEGSGWRAGWAPTTTVYVDATLSGETQAAPGGRPKAVFESEKAMQSDPSALVPLVLWLQALLLVALGVVWAATRWGRWPVWLIGSPVLLALLWVATGTAMGLLPNLV